MAALGIAFRAAGNDFRVYIGQFIKGSRQYGELVSADRLRPWIEIVPMGEGFTWETRDREQDTRKADGAWSLFKRRSPSRTKQCVGSVQRSSHAMARAHPATCLARRRGICSFRPRSSLPLSRPSHLVYIANNDSDLAYTAGSTGGGNLTIPSEG